MTTPTFTGPPTAPSRSDPVTFRTRAAAFVAWLFTFVTELGTAVTWLVDQVAAAAASVTAAAASATAAAASQAAAFASAGAAAISAAASAASAASALNAPGTNATCDDSFAVPAVGAGRAFTLDQVGKSFADTMTLRFRSRSSPADYFIGTLSGFDGSTGAGTLTVTAANGVGNVHADWTVTPAADPVANKATQAKAEAGTDDADYMTALKTAQAIAAQAHFGPDVIAQDQRSSGVAGDFVSASAWGARTLNTLVRNLGSIAALGSGAVTLPAGVWLIEAQTSAGASAGLTARARLYNVTDGAVIAQGENVAAAGDPTSPFAGCAPLHVVTIVTLAAPKAIRLETYQSSAGTSAGALSTGAAEIYTTLKATRMSA